MGEIADWIGSHLGGHKSVDDNEMLAAAYSSTGMSLDKGIEVRTASGARSSPCSPLYVMDWAILAERHCLLDASIGGQEMQLLFTVVALVGGVDLADGSDHYPRAQRAPIELRG